MYERMLDKTHMPAIDEIENYIGDVSLGFLKEFTSAMKSRYDLQCELRFPFGNNYGWGYKFSHKKKHLCYVFFENGAIAIMFQINGKECTKVESVLSDCLPKTKLYWDNRYPCGEGGGWITYRVLYKEELNDVLNLLAVKKKPLAAP